MHRQNRWDSGDGGEPAGVPSAPRDYPAAEHLALGSGIRFKKSWPGDSGASFFSVIRRLAAFQIVFLAPNGWTSVIERLPLGRHHSFAVALAIPNVVLIGANIPGRFSQ
jgi:hypothetical protein